MYFRKRVETCFTLNINIRKRIIITRYAPKRSRKLSIFYLNTKMTVGIFDFFFIIFCIKHNMKMNMVLYHVKS